jgi:molybdate transport system substrate-binding protein
VRLAVLLCAVGLAAGCSSKSSTRKVRIAAASDLAKAFDELGKEFESRTGIAPEFNFGSSGLLAKQIEQGAPYFLFAAANQSFVDQVARSGRCDAGSTKMYARGRIVVWTPSGVAAPVKLADLTEPRFKKIAIANPEHAPYGVAAKQALEKLGLWPQIEGRIVLGENVLATMLYARERNADAAIVALSLAVVSDGGAYLAIAPALHDPLDQQLIVCGNGEEADAARQFSAFVSSREGREVMTRYGFLLPDEKPR